jgi:hypothetical protein
MKWADISPDLLAFIRQPIEEEPESEGIPEPEDMRRRRELWASLPTRRLHAAVQVQPAQARSFATDRYSNPPYQSDAWKRRLVPVIGWGLAAALLFGIVGLLFQQQRANRQLASLQERNAKLEDALAEALRNLRASDSTMQRHMNSLDELERSDNVRRPLAQLRQRPPWPPQTLFLTGHGDRMVAENVEPYELVFVLRQRDGGKYGGYSLFIDKRGFEAFAAEGELDNAQENIGITMTSVVAWPDLTLIARAPKVAPPHYLIKLDRENRTFAGMTSDNFKVSGNIALP